MSADPHPVAVPVRSARAERGFSLVELGIVIAVIAVLAASVIIGMGFFRAAKETKAVDLVLTIHAASRQFAMRHQNGLAYGSSFANLADPNNVSMRGLMGENFLPLQVATPWGAITTVAGANPPITVGPIDDVNGGGPQCQGFACVVITMQVPGEVCVPDGSSPVSQIVANLRNQATIVPTCLPPVAGAISTLTVIMR